MTDDGKQTTGDTWVMTSEREPDHGLRGGCNIIDSLLVPCHH
jgi:hypothetical protein